jgi:hypothetical protein
MQGKTSTGFRALMAAVITRAVEDLKSADPRLRVIERDEAMAFILGEDCEAFCLELAIDYEAVRERAIALYRRFLEREDRPRKPPSRMPKNPPGSPGTGRDRERYPFLRKTP